MGGIVINPGKAGQFVHAQSASSPFKSLVIKNAAVSLEGFVGVGDLFKELRLLVRNPTDHPGLTCKEDLTEDLFDIYVVKKNGPLAHGKGRSVAVLHYQSDPAVDPVSPHGDGIPVPAGSVELRVFVLAKDATDGKTVAKGQNAGSKGIQQASVNTGY